MKLVTLECPKCGAQLEANPALTQAVCNYCGFQFLLDNGSRQVNMHLDNPRHIGYEMEWGRSAQRTDEGRAAADKVRELMQPILNLNRFISERNALSLQMEAPVYVNVR